MHVNSQDLKKTSADVGNVHDTMSEEDPWPEAYDFKARIPGLTNIKTGKDQTTILHGTRVEINTTTAYHLKWNNGIPGAETSKLATKSEEISVEPEFPGNSSRNGAWIVVVGRKMPADGNGMIGPNRTELDVLDASSLTSYLCLRLPTTPIPRAAPFKDILKVRQDKLAVVARAAVCTQLGNEKSGTYLAEDRDLWTRRYLRGWFMAISAFSDGLSCP
ncbi:hypothetical protein IW262DRAFT_1297616 [Armillaria fumosa]|nr:hypothetical protein IW262DRAFT_1297616 [Armillaria fumosa]